jgi:hypothetical protein
MYLITASNTTCALAGLHYSEQFETALLVGIEVASGNARTFRKDQQ